MKAAFFTCLFLLAGCGLIDPALKLGSNSCALDEPIDLGTDELRVNPKTGQSLITLTQLKFDKDPRTATLRASDVWGSKLTFFRMMSLTGPTRFLGLHVGPDARSGVGFGTTSLSVENLRGGVTRDEKETVFETVDQQPANIAQPVGERTALKARIQDQKLYALELTVPVYEFSRDEAGKISYTGTNETLCLKSARVSR